jgi:hypothetical protein
MNPGGMNPGHPQSREYGLLSIALVRDLLGVQLPHVRRGCMLRAAKDALNKHIPVIPAQAGIHCKQQRGPQLSLG